MEARRSDDDRVSEQGKRSPGVKRQHWGTLGKVGICQIGVSVHAVGKKGTGASGRVLYLPEEWCQDEDRRCTAKIPEEVLFKTKPELGVELIERATGWEVPAAPVLGDAADGENTELRQRLHDTELEYVLTNCVETTVFLFSGAAFVVPERNGATGRPRGRLRPESKPVAIGELIAGLHPEQWQTVAFRDGPDSEPMTSRFAFVRVRAAHRWQWGFATQLREEWLICEWPEGRREANPLLELKPPCARPSPRSPLAWPGCAGKIELDCYKQLKGALGLDHCGRRAAHTSAGNHHTALVTAAHGFLTLERLHPFHQRPA